MSLRVCLVSPFAWSQPHDVNEHVAGIAGGLRRLGHHVTVLAPSSRPADLVAGRRALLDGADAEVIALGPAVRVSRRSRVGVPVGVRATLSLALAIGRYDVVHGFEPGLPSLSYLALRDAQALAVATFLSPERLGYPPGRTRRATAAPAPRSSARRASSSQRSPASSGFRSRRRPPVPRSQRRPGCGSSRSSPPPPLPAWPRTT